MVKILEILNLFPHNISFTHNKNNLFYSIYGVLFSTISYIITIYLFYYFSDDLINLKNPKTKIFQSPTEEIINISLNKFFEDIDFRGYLYFNSSLKDIDLSDLLKNAHYLEISIFNKHSSIFLQQFNFEMRPITTCNLDRNCGEYEYKFVFDTIINNSTNFNQSSMKINYTKPIKNFKDIEIEIKNLNIKITYKFKKPKGVKNFTIFNTVLSLFLKDNLIDSNYSFRKYFSFLEDKKGNVVYRIIKLNSDENPFFTNFRTQIIPQVDYYMENINVRKFPQFYEREIFELNLRDFIEIQNRVYKKFLDVISEIGGILNPIFLIGRLLVMNFNEKKYRINILNKLFSDEELNKDFEKFQKPLHYNNIISKKRMNLVKHSKFFFDDFNQSKINPSQNQIKFQFRELKDNSKSFDPLKDSITPPTGKNEISRNIIIKDIQNGERNSYDVSLNTLDIHFSKFNIDIEMSDKKEKLNKFLNFNNEGREEKIKDKKIKDKISDYLKISKTRKQKVLKYNFFEFIFSMICCKRFLNKKLEEKEDIFKKISNKIDFYFEITNLMKFYENFEKMKFILFNKDQINCFEYMIFDLNKKNEYNEEEIIYELNKYFKESNHSDNNQKYYDESFKILMRNEIKDLII